MLAPSFEGLFHLFAVGLSIIAYLVLVSPSNIYAPLERIPFGGRSIGLPYLLVRLRLQILLVCWIYWFTVRGFIGDQPSAVFRVPVSS